MTTKLETFLTQNGLKGAKSSHFSSKSLNHIAMSTPTAACIVALPRATDPIRLLGETDKHATLMFFGETSTLPEDAKSILTQTTQNAALLFTPFTESIIEISRLGSDIPPALVAMLTNNNLGKICEALLINPKLGDYLKNAIQHSAYTPHVTLDYPDYQGEAAIRKIAVELFRIQFDRLALWYGEEQIEFSLDTTEGSMAHKEKLEKFLAHFGRKGQKWGVRRSDAQLRDTGHVTKKDSIVKTDSEGQIVSVKGGSRSDRKQLLGRNVKDIQTTQSPDAIRAHETLTAIRTHKSLTAVSDADLNHLVNRINLEKRFSEINPSAGTKAHNQVKTFLGVGKTMNDAIKFVNTPAGKLLADSLGLKLSKHGKHAKIFDSTAGKKKNK